MFRIKYSREVALKLLYLIDANHIVDADPGELLQENAVFFKGLNDVESGYVFKILEQILASRNEIDEAISDRLIGWRFSRLNVIERNLLRLGVAESRFNDQRAVIIDDIVRMAKKYGDLDSFRIVNAVLDKVIP
ncbi:MAG TPA: hypothetical protein ENN40_03005 [Candidatus Aminicenantes bacterium]|nr:hypothetical protein [Candidatus Aminicenantes bacterium]